MNKLTPSTVYIVSDKHENNGRVLDEENQFECYITKKENQYCFSKEELEDEFNRMIHYVGSHFETDTTIKIKRHAREYLNEIISITH